MLNYIKDILSNIPSDWLKLTTHRLDIYDESRAKVQFLEQFERLATAQNPDVKALSELPTAFDYIRLGHPLSCILEWVIAQSHDLPAEHVISFSSRTAPILAILRKNALDNRKTQIIYASDLPEAFDIDRLHKVYGYQCELKKADDTDTLYDGSTIYIRQADQPSKSDVDFTVTMMPALGSIVVVNDQSNASYISEIQHVRRRETIAMTPANCLTALKAMISPSESKEIKGNSADNKTEVLNTIATITGTDTKALLGSSGLSIQYAIMMGLIDDANANHHGKAIKIIVPPNCYGGTNDQARRVAACLDNVEVVDLPVDGDNDMVKSIDTVLATIAHEDAVPYIIAEIPTNPRVEVPDLQLLQAALTKERKTASGQAAVDPVFILDQTFCPNVHFLGDDDILSGVRTIAYISGSKFPSGGLCTAGYCVGNRKTTTLMDKIERHLQLCDNEATALQIATLAKQMPSMLQRIADAYTNTRAFVNHIKATLPSAKINFVSEELARQGFTPSVFSLDLPTVGDTPEEKESYKRSQNHRLIKMMIEHIPAESKHCVSYGQLKGCYWTIPATSTQGTTKEGDKDYIARVSISPDLDVEKHKEVFSEFVKGM